MLRIFRYFKNLYLLPRRKTADEKCQLVEGYAVTFESVGPQRYITYKEGDREIAVIAEFSLMNDVVLFTDSLTRWSSPSNEPVSDFDQQKVLNRVMKYLSCWGEVTLDSRLLPTSEDFKLDLQKAGIQCDELPSGIIHYSIDIEDERKRKGGWFDR
jgi:hypothetical protein